MEHFNIINRFSHREDRSIPLLRQILLTRRLELGWSRDQAAEHCQLEPYKILRLETSQQRISPAELEKMAAGLGLPQDWLAYKAGYTTRY
jgi:transcriptional regulator with XRE-family HTH domain